MDYAIHTPVFARYHRHLVPLEDLFVEGKSDYEEGESVIRQRLGLVLQCGLVEDV